MSSIPSPRRQREQLIAMRDAAAGAFEAARHKHIRFVGKAEAVSLDYIAGVVTREQVRRVVSDLLESREQVKTAARHVRSYQQMLDKLAIREAREIKARARQVRMKSTTPRPYISKPYLEFSVGPQSA